MDNDALMRRINAATDAKKAQQARAATPAPAAAPVNRPQYAEPQLRQAQPRPAAQGQVQPNQVQSSPVQSSPVQAQQMAQARPAAAPVAAAQTAPHAAPTALHSGHPGAPVHPGGAAAVAAVQHSAPSAAPDARQAMEAPSIATPAAPVEQEEEAQAGPVDPGYDVGTATNPTPPPGKLMTFKAPPPELIKKPDFVQRPMRKEDRPSAFIISCNSTIAIVQGDTGCVDTVTGQTWAVGRMLSVVVGSARVVGMICDVAMPQGEFTPENKAVLHFKVELQGEVQDSGDGKPAKFVKGITSYPGVGSTVHQIRAADLASIYAATGGNCGVIGHLSQDDSIPAFVDVEDMLAKHFAILGSTGCGKSASVSLLMHCAQELIPDLRTIFLDPHNEYSRAFPEANTISQANLDLPFWMFQLEEYVEVLFRGKPLVHEEVDALREFIPDAKVRFRDGEDRVKLRAGSSAAALTADTAAPYRMADLISLIDDEMGLLESRYDKSVLKSLKARIAAHCNDARYAFMFRHKTIEDIGERIISNFFCLPGNGSFSTIIQMAGMPAEVVNSVASVLCRLSFELAIAAKGNMKILVVCEEAHRYVPAGGGGFEPTRRAIGRIAKEGRKYGSFMAIISQRPSELDPTILSQCSTVFSLRLTNHFDQEIIKRAISSSSASTVAFISSLSNRECIAFGEGMSTPMRMRFRNLPKEWLPGAESDVFGNSTPVVSAEQSNMVYRAWRSGAH